MPVTSVSVIIPYRSDEPERQRLFDWCVTRWAALHPDWQLVTPHDGAAEGPFNRSRAVNRGVDMADGEVVIVADADICVRYGQAEEMVASLEAGANWVVGFQRMVHLTYERTQNILTADPDAIDPPAHASSVDIRWSGSESVCGLLALWRSDFLNIGGFCEAMTDWGHEDVAFAYTADTLIGQYARTSGDVAHLFHALRPDRKTNPRSVANAELCEAYARANGNPEAMTQLVRNDLAAR